MRPQPQTPEPAGRATAPEDKPIGALLRDLSEDTSLLIRQESELFRAEIDARVSKIERTAAVLSVGGSIAWMGGLAATAALILGLAELMAPWLAALLVAALYLAVGGVALQRGRERLQRQEIRPEETEKNVKRDVRAIQEAAR